MPKPKILAFAASTRRESFNRRLITLAAADAESAGGEVTLIDLADYPMPIMDEDLEAERGLPDNAQKLKALFLAHDALLLACPEYNSSITPLLKNVIDWVSRPVEGEPRLAPYRDKVAALVSASPSPRGGLRGLVEVRRILGNIGVLVVPDEANIPQAHTAFKGDTLEDDALRQRVQTVATRLVELTARLKAG